MALLQRYSPAGNDPFSFQVGFPGLREKGLFEENYHEFMSIELPLEEQKQLQLHWQFNWLKIINRSKNLAYVTLRDGEEDEVLLKRFQTQMQRSGILRNANRSI